MFSQCNTVNGQITADKKKQKGTNRNPQSESTGGI